MKPLALKNVLLEVKIRKNSRGLFHETIAVFKKLHDAKKTKAKSVKFFVERVYAWKVWFDELATVKIEHC